MRSVRPNLITRLPADFGSYWNSVVINIDWVGLPPFQCLKVGLSGLAKWLIKKSLNKLYILFWFFYCRFRQASKSPLQRWQYFKADILAQLLFNQLGNCNGHIPKLLQKIWYFFPGKQQAAGKTDLKIDSLLIYDFIYDLIYDFFLSKDFQSSYITFDIFKSSTFLGTTEKKKWKVTRNFDNT